MQRIVHGVHGAARGRGGDDGEQGRGGDAEADFLALRVAAGQSERVERVVAVRLRRVADDDAGDEEDAHDREHGPALPLVADHAAEDVGQRSAERKDRDHLHIVGKGGRIFERMRGIGVEEAAAICAEHLDRDLRGNRPDRDGLLGALPASSRPRTRQGSAGCPARPGTARRARRSGIRT